jgi:hypothetical protein
VIATQTVFDDRPGETLPLEYPLPARLTNGRGSVRIGFRTSPGGGSIGSIFDVRTVRAVSAQIGAAAQP